ncbi:MAG: hypothetical protein GY754_11970 [bacterium]|nr:hypothetical protein [bacterium]
MQKQKSILFKLAVLTLLAAAVSSCSKEESGTDIVVLTKGNTYITSEDLQQGIKKATGSVAPVRMSHRLHKKAGLKCINCHHRKNNPSRVKKCVYCHKGLAGAEHLHSFCIDCHKKEQKGPEQCMACHYEKKVFQVSEQMKQQYPVDNLYNKSFHPKHEKRGVPCIKCHHKDGNISDKKKVKKCSLCHKGKSKMRILHIFCKECHKKGLQDAKGPVSCAGCHK